MATLVLPADRRHQFGHPVSYSPLLVTHARRRMKEVPSPPTHKCRIQAAGSVHRDDTDDNGPLELIGPGKDNGGRVREQLEQVLERYFDR